MGALTLVEWQTSINLGLDQFFCKDVINAVTIPAPGRMAPSTAICFVLMGVAIASLQQSDKKRLFGYLLTTSTLIISLLGLTSTMYGVLHIFSFQALTEMALPTAVFFSLISIGTLFAYPEFGLVALLVTNTTGGEAARRFLPACILMPIVLGRVILAGQTSGLYTAPFAAALQTICLVIFLTLLIWWVSHIMTLQDQSRQIDQERKAAIARAQAASRFKSEFLADMSHEIRTPMNGILGMTEILLRSGLNEKQLGFANIMKDAGNALLAVINDILDYSKIDAGRLKIEKNDCKLTDLVEGVADLLSIQASNKKLSLLTFIDPKIPTYLHSDAGRIRQILTNLAGNAIKFSDKGEILIRVSMESSTSEAENTDQQSAPDTVSINFAVTDNGIGMSDDEVRQLFQPFVQLSAGLSRPDGTGLGLTICKKLVELMDGTISVHSVKGHGTTFSFLLKMEVGQKAEKTDILDPALKDIKVLIVDDETAGREILHEYLDAREIKNDLARSGQEALCK